MTTEALADQSESLYQTILSNISDTVLITDSAGDFKFVCPNIHVIFGYSEQEIRNLSNITALLGPELLAQRPVGARAEVANIETEVKDKQGKLHTLLVNIKAISIYGESFLFTCRDITERKQAEQALRESEEALRRSEAMYRLIVNTAHEGIWQVDSDLRTVYANPHLAQMFGYQQSELYGKTVYDFVEPEVQEQVRQASQQRQEIGAIQVEIPFKRYDGSTLWGLVVSSTLYDESSRQIGAIAFVTDITERKQSEQALLEQSNYIEVVNQELHRQLVENLTFQHALAENEAALASLINNVDDSIFSIDLDRNLVSFNTAFARRAAERLGIILYKGMPLAEFFPASYLNQYFPLFDRVLTGEHVFAPTYISLPQQGIEVHNEVTCNPTFGPSGEVIGASIFVRDVTESKKAELALRESEERFRRVVENIPLTFFLYDAELGQRIYTNKIGQKTIFEITGETENTRGIFQPYMHPDDLEALQPILKSPHSLTNGSVEYRVMHPSGEYHYLHHFAFPIVELDGAPLQIANFIEDITERKRTEQALKRNEQLLANILANLPIGVAVYSLSGKILSINPRGAQVIAQMPETLIDRNIHEVLPQAQLDLWYQLTEMALQANHLVQYESNEANDGIPHSSLIGCFPLFDAEGNIFALGHSLVDITDQKRIQNELRELSKQIIEVQEKERRHIARELHDEVGQSLTGILLLMNKVERSAPTTETETIKQIQTIVRQLMAQIRELSHNLHPPILDNHGLMGALRWYCNHYSTQTQIQVAFKYSGLQQRFTPEVELTCYRVIQEALTNIARYARVPDAKVDVVATEASIQLRIEDKGVGFDTTNAREKNETFGLSGMTERVALLGGKIDILSSPGKGTSITAEIPLISDLLSE